jgi:hypothetical protein
MFGGGSCVLRSFLAMTEVSLSVGLVFVKGECSCICRMRCTSCFEQLSINFLSFSASCASFCDELQGKRSKSSKENLGRVGQTVRRHQRRGAWFGVASCQSTAYFCCSLLRLWPLSRSLFLIVTRYSLPWRREASISPKSSLNS